MKRATFLAVAAAGLCSTLLAAPAQAQAINLKIANFFPPPSGQSKAVEAFGQALESRSGGKIKVQYFAGGSLLGGPNMFKGIESGVADIGYTHVYYTPGRMPVSEGVGLPIGMPTGWVGVHVGNDFYEKYRPKEFAGVKVLTLHANGPSMIITKQPVTKLEDLKGVTIRAPGLPGDIVKALGGTPTPTPMMEVYDSISKGVNEGVWGPYETLRTFRFAEVAKNVTVSWQIGASFPFYLAMNQNSYNRLSPDLKKVIDSVSAEWVEQFARMWNEIDLEGKAYADQRGVNYIELSPQEAARWQKAVEPVIGEWSKSMTGKGFKESEVKNWIAFMRDRIKYWTAKQIEAKIPSPTGPLELRPEKLGKK
jgi:TRAP-type C4-dicarboxylate transport system substrate-binding protein